MLIFLNLVLLIILLSTLKIPIHTVFCADVGDTLIAAESDDLTSLKEVFYRNLMEDFRAENGHNDEITPELEERIDRRIRGFWSGTYKERKDPAGVDESQSDGQRRDTRSVADESIDADTAGAEHLYLKGFRERGHVPVNFPIDICLLKVGQKVFAASLHVRKSKETYTNHTVVSFYIRETGHFKKYMEYTAILARKFDCISHASLGFVAVVNYYDNARFQESPQTHRSYDDGSPVFQIQENGTTEIVQKFSQSNQNTVHMWTHGNHIYLTHTYTNLDESVANVCPLYRWSGYHFDVIDELPCYNSIHIEPFTVEQSLFIAIANQMNDEAVDEDTFSDVFKFDYERQKFEFHQKIYVYSVSDIAYFFLDHGDVREHFLVTGNSRAGKKSKAGKLDYDQHSIVYKYIDGYFVPFQKFELHQVKQFLPVMHENGEFLLVIACRGRPLQIYEYDGWKFSPSRIDYTREAFAVGVSHMRVYRHIINASLIVIANRNLYGTSANLFTPIYGIENDLKEVYAEFINWCGETTEQLSKLNLEEVYNQLVTLPKVDKGVVKIDQDVELRGSTIETLRTHALHTDNFVYDQRTFDYLNRVHSQLQGMKRKVEKLRTIIDDSLKLNDTLEVKGDLKVPQVIASEGLVKELNARKVNDEPLARNVNDTEETDIINVDRLIVDDRLSVQFLNGYASKTLLHTTDDLQSLKDIDVHANEVVIKGELFVNKLIDGVHFTADNVLLHGVDQVFSGKTLQANNLVIENLVTKKINSTDVATIMYYLQQASEIDRARSGDHASPDYPMRLNEIRVQDLELTGLMNDIDINYLDRNALKVVGDQVITGSMNFDNIIATKVITPDKRLSGVDLNALVLTEPIGDNPDFRIRPDVIFTKTLNVENLELAERLNHIDVVDDELKVLLLNPKEPQLITATKTFDNVELLGPIFMQGKINSSNLSKLNPTATISQDVYLEGDFEIGGEVSIKHLLNVTNIYGASKTYNYEDLYLHGLPLTAASSSQDFTFNQPLFVQSVFSESLNGMNPNDFIPVTSNKVHRITGRKTFPSNLTIRGDRADAAVINKVDLKQLNQTVLKRTGDQVIEGTIHFKELILNSIVSKETFFEGRPLSTLLTVNGKQHIKSKVRFEKCKLNVQGDINAVDLFASNASTIFGYDLDYLLKDTLQRNGSEQESITITGPKSFYNLTIGELVLTDQATLNGVDLLGLKKINAPFEKTVILEETLILKHPINARNVFFNGSINGVRKEEFGRAWLLNEYNQTFTAPQTFENIVADRVYVEGFFNGVKLDDLIQDLYFLDREERVDRAIFHEELVSYQPVTIKGLVSGLNLSTDVLLHYSAGRQDLEDVRIDGNLVVRKGIKVRSTLNGMNYAKLKEFASGSGADRPLNVEVRGSVHFQQQPEVVELNGHNMEQLHREIWLLNRDEVLTGAYHFKDARFASFVHTKGPINTLNLDEISQTYLSVSKSQNVTTPLIFKGLVEFRDRTTFESTTLEGLLKGSKDSPGIDIVDLDKHALKKDVPQTITGKWIFHDLEVYGSLNLTTLNGLNIQQDILLNHATKATFTGPKRFDSLHIHNLKCPEPCVIQGVDVSEWFANAVRLNRNHTIEGVTYLEAGIVLGDIEAKGLVNNITFDKDHLLLKSVPQTIEGDLYVRTKFPKQNLIYPSSIESLEVDTINGKNFNKFMNNLVRSDQSTLVINTSVTLTQTLEAQSVDTGDSTMFGVNINQLLQEVEYRDQLSKYESKLRSLHVVGQSLVETFNTKTPYLSHYQPIKTLPGRFRNVVTITLPLSPTPVELLAAHVDDGNRTAVEFYRWYKKEDQFRIAKGFPPITAPNLIISHVKRINLNFVQHLFVQFYDILLGFYRQSILDLESPDLITPKKTPRFVTIYEFNSSVPRDIVTLKLLDLDCVGLFTAHADGMEVHCLHLENLLYYMRFHQSLVTPAVQQALYLDGRLIILSRENLLQVWRPEQNYKFVLSQLVKALHPTFITVAKFDHQLFIAINSAHDLTDTAHHGSVEIWRDLRPKYRNSTFVKYQTILTKVPKQIQFSVIPSTAELMLYTLNENRFHPLVFYRYEGVSGFREYLTSNALRVNSKRLGIVKLDRNQRELLALIAEKEIVFIEAIMKGR